MMEKPFRDIREYFQAFIRTAQYIPNLTSRQDIISETGKVLVSFYGADLFGFFEPGIDGGIKGHTWILPDGVQSIAVLTKDTEKIIAGVLETGFLAAQQIKIPEPFATVFLPIIRQNQNVAVMLVGHRTSDPIPKELLDIYLAVASLVRDVTERKKGEDALRKSEEKFRNVFDWANDGILLHTLTTDGAPGRFIDMNLVTCRMLGYSREELLTMGPPDIVPYELHPQLADIIRQAQGKDTFLFESRVRRKDGTTFPVESSGRLIDYDGKKIWISHIRDITERKRADVVLRESEECVRQKLESLLSPGGDIGILELGDIIDARELQLMMNYFYAITHMGIGIIDIKGNVLVGTGWQEICTGFHRVNPETCANCIESDTLLTEGVEPGTFRKYRCKNNMWDIVTPIIVGGKHVGNIFLGQFLYDDESIDIEFFRAQAARYEFDEQAYLAALERVPRWSRETVDTLMAFYAKFARMISTLSYHNLQLARTVTERDTLLHSLRESEERYRQLVDNTDTGFMVIDDKGTVLEANEPYMRLIGAEKREEIIGHSVIEWTAPEAQDSNTAAVALCSGQGSIQDFETIYLHRDGTHIHITINATTHETHGGEKRIVSFCRNITERKQNEEILQDFNKKLQQGIEEKTATIRDSELRHRMLFESSRDAIMTLEPPDWRFTSGNPATVEMFLSGDEAGFNSAAPWELSPEFQPDGRSSAEKAIEMIEKAAREGSNYFEWTHRRLDGEDFPATVLLTRFEWKGKEILQATVRDITGQKQAEDKIKASLDEKVLLLREIHHRVKNNLQIIISLVNLQMRQIDDDRLKQVMMETQNRVRVMSLVHERLYQSEDIGRIDFADYTRFLATQLFTLYGMDSRQVTLKIDIGTIMLGINTAIPIGLIINELVSNSLRHGFPDNRNGQLAITAREEGNALTLIIRDNGIGLPKDLDWRNTESLGLRLVTTLTDQLNGTIELVPAEEGTGFTIRIREVDGS